MIWKPGAPSTGRLWPPWSGPTSSSSIPTTGSRSCRAPRGRKGSSKFVYLDEIADHYREGRSALVYQHFGRSKTREAAVAEAIARLGSVLPGATFSAFEASHALFLLAARPEHAARAAAVVEMAKRRNWTPEFFRPVWVEIALQVEL